MTDPFPSHPGAPVPPRPASLARRLVPAVVILGAAGGLLVALDHPGDPADAVGTDEAALPLDPSATPTTVVPAPTTTAPANGGSGSSRSTTTTVPATPTCTGTTSEVAGSTVSTKYGPMQVQATVDADGTLCAVTALQTPANDRKSVSINQRAVPTLTQRALAAGGTNFSGVSGATITSNAYKQSLQAILDQQ